MTGLDPRVCAALTSPLTAHCPHATLLATGVMMAEKNGLASAALADWNLVSACCLTPPCPAADAREFWVVLSHARTVRCVADLCPEDVLSGTLL